MTMKLGQHISPASRSHRHPRRFAVVPSALALAIAGTAAHAAPVEFADDFSADSLRLTVDRRLDDRAERTYDILADRIEVSVSATGDDDQGQAELDPWGRSDSIRARVSLDRVDLPVDRRADARVRVAGQLWNDTADGGFDGRTGDVYVQVRLRARGDGSREASICVDRENNADGGDNEGVPLFGDGDDCETFPDFVPEFGVPYDIAMSVDRAEGVLTYSVDDMIRSVSLGQPVFVPFDDRRSVQVVQEGVPGITLASIYGVGTDDGFQDFSVDPPVIGPYRPFFDLTRGGRSLDVVDGRARLEVASSEGGDERVSIPVIGESDSIEATLELASASSVAAGSDEDDDRRLEMSLGGTLYNDTAAGGFNGDEGSVFATVVLQQLADESLAILFCAYRSNTENFSDTLALLEQDGEDCMDSGIDAALDTAYPVSLVLDRDAGTMTFAAAESEFVYTIATPVFPVAEGRQFIRARARALDGSTAVGFVDDYRTSADAPLVAAPPAADTDMDAESDAGMGTDMDVDGMDSIDGMDGVDGMDGADGTTAEGDADGDVAENTDGSVGQHSGGGSSSSGCSIAGRGGDGFMGSMIMLAGAGFLARRRRRRLVTR